MAMAGGTVNMRRPAPPSSPPGAPDQSPSFNADEHAAMKLARRTARSRLRRASRIVLFCGVIWLSLQWSYEMLSSSPSLSPTNGYSSLPLPSPNAATANMHQDDDDYMSTHSQEQESDLADRHYLSSTSNTTGTTNINRAIKNDEHGNLRGKSEPTTQLQLQHSYLNQSAPHTSLVYPLHAKSGTHHAYMYIGSPPQRQTLIVDTGSRLTAFPCQPHCPNCGTHASKQFQLNASSSHSIVPCDECKLSQSDFPLDEYFAGDGIGDNSGDGPSLRGAQNNLMDNLQGQQGSFPNSCINGQCRLDQRYTEGSSWKAFEVKDKVWLGLDETALSLEEHNKYSTPYVFGCQVQENGLFRSQYADGIMGMAMYTQTLFGTWMEHKSISHQSFSLCFNPKGGHIALGGTGSTYNPSLKEPDAHTSAGRLLAPMQFTPFAKENVWYYTVTVTSISVGNHVLPESLLQLVNDHKGTIVDSGTTDTFISHKLAKPFTSAWEKITGHKYHNRVQKYTYEQFKGLPVITFELQGALQWDIKPKHYMEAESHPNGSSNNDPNSGWEGKRGFISRVYVDEPQGVVLGSNAMMEKEIFFDITNRRLGVANAKCAY